MSEQRQTEHADFNDLAAVLEHSQRGWTVDFQSAVLAALKRIEERLPPPSPVFIADMDDEHTQSLVRKLCERPLRPGAVIFVSADEMKAFRRIQRIA